MRRAAGLDDSASDVVGAHKRRAIRTAIQDMDGGRGNLKPFIFDIPLGWDGRRLGRRDDGFRKTRRRNAARAAF
jgi:hypothetical protein